MTVAPDYGDKHVSFFLVPLIGALFGFIAAWLAGAVCGLVALVAYGFGVELAPPYKAIAFIFSAVTTIVTLIGWTSWASAALSGRGKA